jgi:hypothetical protein
MCHHQKNAQARHIVDFRDGSWYREDVYDFLRRKWERIRGMEKKMDN